MEAGLSRGRISGWIADKPRKKEKGTLQGLVAVLTAIGSYGGVWSGRYLGVGLGVGLQKPKETEREKIWVCFFILLGG